MPVAKRRRFTRTVWPLKAHPSPCHGHIHSDADQVCSREDVPASLAPKMPDEDPARICQKTPPQCDQAIPMDSILLVKRDHGTPRSLPLSILREFQMRPEWREE